MLNRTYSFNVNKKKNNKKTLYIVASILIFIGLFLMSLSFYDNINSSNNQHQNEVNAISTSIVETAKFDFYNQMTSIANTPTPVFTPIAMDDCTVTTRIYGENISANVHMTFVGSDPLKLCIKWLELVDASKEKDGITFTTFLDEYYKIETAPKYCDIYINNSDTRIILSSDVESIGKIYCENQNKNIDLKIG